MSGFVLNIKARKTLSYLYSVCFSIFRAIILVLLQKIFTFNQLKLDSIKKIL